MGRFSTNIMFVSKILRSFIKPHWILFFPIALSFLAWIFPDFGFLRKGFDHLPPPLSKGVFLAFFWYILALVVTFLGYYIGSYIKLSSKLADQYANLRSDFGYKILTLFVVLGTLAVAFKLFYSLSVVQILQFMVDGNANQLKYKLYEDYSIGLLSLRYVTIHAFPVAIFRRFFLKKKSFIDYLNIISLAFTSIISSRLTLIMALLSTIILFIIHSPKIKLNIFKLTAAGLTLFFVLSFLSYSRNKSFYEQKDLYFFWAGVSEIVTYLGTPFQGASSVGNNHHLITKDPINWTAYAGIEPSLSTNSAFLELFSKHRWFCFPIMFFTLFIASCYLGITKNYYGNYLILSNCTIFYAFAEFWRLFWFGKGIMITLFIIPFFVFGITFLVRKATKKTIK